MKRRDLIPHVVFLGPASVLFLLAVVIPFGVSVFYSLTDWNGIGKTYQFVGPKNYIDVFTGRSQFLHSAKFTILLGLAVVVLTNVLGVALAALLSNSFRGSGLFRAVFFLPNTMGGVVMGYIWRFLFLMVVGALGTVFSWEILQLPWLGTPGTAYAALIIVSVWQGAGYVMIIMIAALTGIPQELEEAATIDGANGWRIFLADQDPPVHALYHGVPVLVHCHQLQNVRRQRGADQGRALRHHHLHGPADLQRRLHRQPLRPGQRGGYGVLCDYLRGDVSPDVSDPEEGA